MDSLSIYSAAVEAVAVASNSATMKSAAGDSTMGGGNIDGADMEALGTGVEFKDPILASWPFVAGISAGVLVVSIAFGAFLAKRKIKKGIDLYED